MSKVTIVNNQDEVIGAEDRKTAFANGLIRRNSRIWLFNPRGEIFLQQRSATKDVYPNRWTESAGGHVDPGEDYEQAAYRELEEEIGISNIKLDKFDYFYDEIEIWKGIVTKKFNTMYKATVDEQQLKLNPEEVSGGDWFTLDQVDQMIASDPDKFPPGFIYAWQRNRKKFYKK